MELFIHRIKFIGYMAKNLYSIKADDVLLCPSDPNAENFFQAKYVVNDDAWFWQSPYQE